MTMRTILAPTLLVLLLPACQQDTPGPPDQANSFEVDPGPTAPPTGPTPTPETGSENAGVPAPLDQPPAGYTDGNGINENYPDLTPAPLTPDSERTETGARNVLISFTRAIEMREYDQAWNMLGPSAKAKWSKAEFNELFDGLDDITMAAPGGTMEGAAGSSYYTVQSEITASDADGRPVAFEGPIVLRRVNDVPGASAEQLRWRIESFDMGWTH